MHLIAAAKVCSLVFLTHCQVLIKFATTHIPVSTDRAQHRRVGVAGGACAAKRRGRTTGMAGLLCPPAKY